MTVCKARGCENQAELMRTGTNNHLVETGVCSEKCYSSLFIPGEKKFNREPDPLKAMVGLLDEVQKGLRYNEGKARTDLIPAAVMLKLAEHYTYGANKYAPNNWAKGFPYSETYASLTRHLYAWWAGEKTDEESGAHHLIAVIWNAVTLMYFELFPGVYEKFDDRLKVGDPVRPVEKLQFNPVPGKFEASLGTTPSLSRPTYVPTPENRAHFAEIIRTVLGTEDSKVIEDYTQRMYRALHDKGEN